MTQSKNLFSIFFKFAYRLDSDPLSYNKLKLLELIKFSYKFKYRHALYPYIVITLSNTISILQNINKSRKTSISLDHEIPSPIKCSVSCWYAECFLKLMTKAFYNQIIDDINNDIFLIKIKNRNRECGGLR